MNLLEEYEDKDIIGFSFNHNDYEVKKMEDNQLEKDEPELRMMECLPKSINDIQDAYVLLWEDDAIVGTPSYIFDWIIENNYGLHSIEKSGSTIYAEIHDHDNVWPAAIHKVTSKENKL